MASTKNCTTLRLLHYPSISEDTIVKPGQIRCGEHTDYGSITLLFQDDMPGLEVNINAISFYNIKGKTTEFWLVRERVLFVNFCSLWPELLQRLQSIIQRTSMIIIPKIFQGHLKTSEDFQRSSQYFGALSEVSIYVQ